jgi:sarcosine oxidase subunit delta
MKIMPCPLNGPRNIQEFAYGGEVTATPGPDAPAEVWAEYAFFPGNRAGVVREWWMHLATGYWFIAERDTVSDDILRTYPPDEARDEPADTEPAP